MLSRGEAYNSEAWQAWEAAHAEITAADRQEDDLPTDALAAACL